MAIFNRKKDKSVLPEVDQYYQGERRDRAWLAWVLAVISIAIVVLVLVGLFFGGRWAYNSITNDEPSEVAVNQDEELPSFDGGENESETDSSSQVAEPSNENDTNSQEDAATENSDDEDSEGTVDAPAQTTIPSGQTDETPRTGAGDDLPETGPAGLATTFLVTSGVAGTAHYLVTRKRQTSKK